MDEEQKTKEANELEQCIIDAIDEYAENHPDTTCSDVMSALHCATVRIVVAISDGAAERADIMSQVREHVSGMAQDVEECAAFNNRVAPTTDRAQ
jgi:hypothetical protein